jgi:hypothetical protein
MTMTRKEFLKGTGAVVAVALAGCGGGGGGGNPPTDCGTTIELNHGHVLTVAKADATAGVDKTYHIQGSATHDHTVTLTAAQFADLAAGNEVTITSSVDAAATHDHNITVNCA